MKKKQIKGYQEKNEVKKHFEKRLIFFQWMSNFFFFILLVHLFNLQVIDPKHYEERGNLIRKTENLNMRGDILDSNGFKLATDQTVYEIYAHPKDYVENRPTNALAEILAPYMTINKKDLETELNKKENITITLRRNVDKQTADAVKQLGLREISVRAKHKRIYPQGSMAAHILGYYSSESEHSTGIENIASNKLQKTGKQASFQKTRFGDIIYEKELEPENTVKTPKGENITLTIDSAIQHICEVELEKTIKEKKAERGSIIVMNPRNGEILSYASYPTFNPNEFYKYPQINMKNWSLTDIYPPGSTFKAITVAAAMDLGKINEKSLIEDTGKMKIGSWPIKNYDYAKNPNPGKISLEYLIEHSSNIGSAKIAMMMKPTEFYDILKNFGFGQKTGIDLPAESAGILPKPLRWDIARHASMGYGYGASVTALQMISAISVLANDGIFVTPHVIKYNQEEYSQKIKTRQVIKPETARTVTKILAKSIANGKTPLNFEHYSVAAKTGTSRKTREKAKGYSKNVYTSAVGYFPASNPQIAIYVVIDSPKTGADWGNTVASPVFREVALHVARIKNIQFDK